MASGRNHDRITFICLPFLGIASWSITHSIDLTAWLVGSFLFSGLMFGPDLDIHSRQSMRWGFLQWLWLPYQRWIPHRSPLSHGPIMGTIIRLLYVGCWCGSLVWIYQSVARVIGQPPGRGWEFGVMLPHLLFNNQKQAVVIFIGLELGAMSHYVADFVSSRVNKWRGFSSRSKQNIKSSRRQ